MSNYAGSFKLSKNSIEVYLFTSIRIYLQLKNLWVNICTLLFFRQLTSLVKERHEAFAKLKTAEDLLEATRSENEILRKNLPALSTGSMQSLHGSKFIR